MRDLQLQNVELLGAVPQDELNACYRRSHVFLCMSEHEGFCIPLIESMVHDVPILAYAAAAVPGDARRRRRPVPRKAVRPRRRDDGPADRDPAVRGTR